MKNALTYLTFIVFILLLSSCGGDQTKNKATVATKTEPAAEKRSYPADASNKVALESISRDQILELWETCTYIDYIFHTLPFAMSQDEQGSIRANLNYISSEAQPWIPVSCKPIARQMFHVQGEIVLEADVYLNEVCQFYVFVENEKPIFANKMTPDALKFFGTMFDQVDKKQPK